MRRKGKGQGIFDEREKGEEIMRREWKGEIESKLREGIERQERTEKKQRETKGQRETGKGKEVLNR